VEREGRDSDGVRVALLGRDRAREESEDAATHQALVTALLCAALFPQVVAVEQPIQSKKKKNKKGNGNEGGQPPKFFMREPGNRDPVQVNIHPSSVNSKASPSSLNLAVFLTPTVSVAVP